MIKVVNNNYSHNISKAQRSAQELPQIEKYSINSCSVNGGHEMVVTGSNFLPESKIIFFEKGQGKYCLAGFFWNHTQYLSLILRNKDVLKGKKKSWVVIGKFVWALCAGRQLLMKFKKTEGNWLGTCVFERCCLQIILCICSFLLYRNEKVRMGSNWNVLFGIVDMLHLI